jgi:hypothetical protein
VLHEPPAAPTRRSAGPMASTAIVVSNVLAYLSLLAAFIVLTIRSLKYKVGAIPALILPGHGHCARLAQGAAF